MAENELAENAVGAFRETFARNKAITKRERKPRPVKEVTSESKIALEVVYTGALADSEQVFCHFGYGKDWSNATTLAMVKLDGKWVCAIPLRRAKKVQFCFKNNRDEWDNNGGSNWSLISETQVKH